ncbi:DUF4442 domain-containing protein [Endozoicomonadaceae bacterium StTr2]
MYSVITCEINITMLHKSRLMKFMLSMYPPWLGGGIYVKSLSRDFRQAEVGMKLRWYNRNYVRTQFGGSLYSMTDPMYMLMLMHNLGKDYIVWDKAAAIDFVSPGTGEVHACFDLTETQIEDIRQKAASGKAYLPEFKVAVKDREGKLVATVKKTLYVRLKQKPAV